MLTDIVDINKEAGNYGKIDPAPLWERPGYYVNYNLLIW